MKKLYGVGFIGEGVYNSNKNKNLYTRWKGMLSRCYNEKIRYKQPSYINCLVDEHWHNFQNFAEWYEKNHIEGFQLDKDILVKGNKVYSSETCCFVPHEINSLFTGCKSVRGDFPIGVRKNGNKFQAACRIRGIKEVFGEYATTEDAFYKYKTEKEKYIKEVADKWKDLISEQVYQAMYKYQVEITD